MKFMLMMNAKGLLEEPGDMQRAIAHMVKLSEELHANGELVSTEGLTGPDRAKLVRAGKGGAPVVSDGPFPESKEFLLGYWLVDCDGPERAYEIAARISAVPGPGGAPANMPIEVREVAGGSSEDEV